MPRGAARIVAALGAVLGVVGLVGAVIFQLQPWRGCPYDDSPAACAMLPQDSAAFLGFTVVLLVGCVALLTARVLHVRSTEGGRRAVDAP